MYTTGEEERRKFKYVQLFIAGNLTRECLDLTSDGYKRMTGVHVQIGKSAHSFSDYGVSNKCPL